MSKSAPLRSEQRAAEKAKARAAKPPTAKQVQRQAAVRAARRRRILGYTVAALFAAGLIGLGVLVAGGGGQPAASDQVTVDGPPRSAELQVGERIPDYTAPGIAGGTIEWSKHVGEAPILLTVWAPWCPHCQAELPVLAEVAKDYPGVHVMTVVTSVGDQPGPDPLAFMQDNGISFETAVDDGDETIMHALGVQGFPMTYAVDRDGVVVQAWSGEIGEQGLRDAFEQLEALAEG
jgi:thiol-disulfide isomerase/thioredoxin